MADTSVKGVRALLNVAFTVFSFLALQSLIVSSCFDSVPGDFEDDPVIIRNTDEYRKTNLKISLPQARELAEKYALKNGLNVKEVRYHVFLVGSEYHFFRDFEKWGISLAGYYVDGNTGRVEYRSSLKGVLTYKSKKAGIEMNKEIKRYRNGLKDAEDQTRRKNEP